ncbi:hypothetical protein PTTW11_03135 [Pyrenophora teres f. teres]|uniref:Polyprotein n=1 Tax=Pyrenophora teres f. teres TaxID=97479 RepID=A0A6S6VWB9_9PLEO|nr:hypothetical protein PTTW11_03135 [Pyrenophora teres f. teres]
MATETASSNRGCTLTREELLGTTNLKAREWRHIDPEIWDDDIEAPNDEIDETAATTYIARAIADYTDRPTADAELFGEFLQDFQGWTEAMFMRANATYTKELKRILRFKGVFTGRVNMPPSEAVAKLLRKEECPKWPDDQFQSTAFDERSAAHMLQQYRLKGRHDTGTAQPTSRAQSQTSARTRDQDAEEQQTDAQVENRTSAQVNQQLAREGRQRTSPLVETIEQTPQTNERRQADQRQQSQQPRLTYNNFDRFREYTPAYPQRPKGISIPPIIPSDDTDLYKAIPPIECGNEKLDPQKINVFSKMWDREKKYTGKPYDLLDDKLKIFYSICYHADIQPEQFHAVFPRILEGRAQDYYLHFVDQRADTFLTVYLKLKNHFDTDVNHSHYYADWTTISFAKVRRENPDKTLHEVLDIMLDKLQLCQRALGQQYMGEYALRTTVITACRGVREFAMALYRPSLECEVLFGDLRSSIENSLAMSTSVNFIEGDQDNQYYPDRRYNSNRRGRGRSQGRGGTRGTFPEGEQRFDSSRGAKPNWKKKCFVCQKEGCWSTNHTDEERKAARTQFFSACHFSGGHIPVDFSVHLAEYKGNEHISHREVPSAPASQFLLEDRYKRSLYQGILPDTGAANVSTVGKEQYLALTREDPTVKLDTSTAGKALIKFRKGEAIASIGTVQVSTEIRKINFEVLEAPTPFLLCLTDMDRLKVYFNNTTDELVQGNIRIPVLRKWGHP